MINYCKLNKISIIVYQSDKKMVIIFVALNFGLYFLFFDLKKRLSTLSLLSTIVPI